MNHRDKEKMARTGEATLRSFQKLIQTARIHQASNQLLIGCIENFSNALKSWWQEDDGLTIKLSRGRFIIQDEKLRYDAGNVKLVQEM